MPFDGIDFSHPSSPEAKGNAAPAPSGFLGAMQAACKRLLETGPVKRIVSRGHSELIDPTSANLLRRARLMVETEERWVQGYYSTSDGRRCAMGALRAASRHSDNRRVRARAHQLLREVARERGYQSVEGMNDRCTHSEVLNAFNTAIFAADNPPRHL